MITTFITHELWTSCLQSWVSLLNICMWGMKSKSKDHEKQFPVPVESCHVYPMGIHQIHQMLYQLSSRAWAMDSWGKPWGHGGKSNSQKWHSFPMSQRSRRHWLLNYPKRFVVHQQDHKSHRSFQLGKKKSFGDQWVYQRRTNCGILEVGSYNPYQSMEDLLITMMILVLLLSFLFFLL